MKGRRGRGPMGDDQILESFVHEIKRYFGPRLKKLILFGSRARGDYSEESDYDCIIMLDKVSTRAHEFVDKLELKMLLSHFVLFTAFLLSEEELNRRKFEPFIINALKEGIVL